MVQHKGDAWEHTEGLHRSGRGWRWRAGFWGLMVEQSPWQSDRYGQESYVFHQDDREHGSICSQQFTRQEASQWKWPGDILAEVCQWRGFMFHRKWFESPPAVSGKLWKGIRSKAAHDHIYFFLWHYSSSRLDMYRKALWPEVGRNTLLSMCREMLHTDTAGEKELELSFPTFSCVHLASCKQ